MKYRRLGRSGLKVSEISLGSWLTYGGSVAQQESERIIDKAYSLGINLFDTANVYAHGAAEEILGKAVAKYPRGSYVIATKVFFPMGDRPNEKGLSRKHIFDQCEASLRRLGVDYIDLYQCHRYDPDTPLDETLHAFDDLVTQGKILYYGVSEWNALQIGKAISESKNYSLHRMISNQPVYNMLNRYIEKEIIPLCEREGIGQIVFSPLAQGVLSGKYKIGQQIPADSRAADQKSNQWIHELLQDTLLKKVERLSKIAHRKEITMAQLALAWILRLPNVSSCITGASRVEQVEENVMASQIALTKEDIQEIDAIVV